MRKNMVLRTLARQCCYLIGPTIIGGPSGAATPLANEHTSSIKAMIRANYG